MKKRKRWFHDSAQIEETSVGNDMTIWMASGTQLRKLRRGFNQNFLVGGLTNPFEKYAGQNGNLSQVGVKINIWNHHLVFI